MSRWENIGDKYLLNALGDDPLAASQSVAMYLDPVAKCIEWHTNGHVIRMRPDLPSAIVSGPFATSFGYEWNLAGGLVFGVGDVSLTKRAGILDQWGIEGVQLYYIVPVGQIPDIPVVKIEKIDILDGMIDQLDLTPQGVLSAEMIEAGASQSAPWGDNSMAMSWAGKRNNNSSDNNSNYMAGMVLQKAPPLAMPLVCADLQAGNLSNRSFGAANGSETTGWYEVLSGGFQKAFNYQDLADSRGVGTHYAFAATLGYTTILTINHNSLKRSIQKLPISIEAGTLESYTTYFNGIVQAGRHVSALYTDSSGVPSSLVANSTSDTYPTSGGAGWVTATVSSGATLADATRYWIWLSGLNFFFSLKYGNLGGDGRWYSATAVSPPPASSPQAGMSSHGSTISQYLTYSAGGGGGIIPQIMHHRQLQRRR